MSPAFESEQSPPALLTGCGREAHDCATDADKHVCCDSVPAHSRGLGAPGTGTERDKEHPPGAGSRPSTPRVRSQAAVPGRFSQCAGAGRARGGQRRAGRGREVSVTAEGPSGGPGRGRDWAGTAAGVQAVTSEGRKVSALGQRAKAPRATPHHHRQLHVRPHPLGIQH